MRGAGRAMFVAILLLIVGTLNLIYGIGAIADANFWVGDNRFVFGDLHTWGWITAILGAIQLLAAFSLLGGGAFGRIFGIVAAGFGALGALLAVGGAYPFWALGIFALCIICIHGLVVFGETETERKPSDGVNA